MLTTVAASQLRELVSTHQQACKTRTHRAATREDCRPRRRRAPRPALVSTLFTPVDGAATGGWLRDSSRKGWGEQGWGSCTSLVDIARGVDCRGVGDDGAMRSGRRVFNEELTWLPVGSAHARAVCLGWTELPNCPLRHRPDRPLRDPAPEIASFLDFRVGAFRLTCFRLPRLPH